MNYWWVNHNQTHTEEIKGNYIWSPRKNRGGRNNETYNNLFRTSPGDTIFSYANATIKAAGIVAGSCSNADRPDFGATGEQWDCNGWMVPVNWTILDVPLSPKNHIDKIGPLLPKKNSPLRKNGNGVQNCYLASISNELGEYLFQLLSLVNPRQIESLRMIPGRDQLEDAIQASIMTSPGIPETERSALVKSRRGQGLFRDRVMAIESTCRVTGVELPPLLVASHIKPWRSSTNLERLDGANGLMFSPHIDKLFDAGWISFQDDGSLIISQNLPKEVATAWHIKPTATRAFLSSQRDYLAYHRAYIFKK